MTTATMSAPAATTLRDQLDELVAEIAPAWPLERFVAVNPLAGLEHLPFAEAADRAQRTFGAPGWRAEDELRAAERAGRIDRDALRRALRERLGAAADDQVDIGHGRTVPLEEVLLADLLHAPPAPRAVRETHTPAEAWDAVHGTRIAAVADEMMSGWLAAYLDAGKARWGLPHRDRGLYGAWRALAPHDPALARAARRRIAALPADAVSALAAMLRETGLGAARREVLLRALLTRQPGWASHARWRQEHVGDLDVAELAAVRLACERALLHREAGRDALARLPEVPPAPAGDPRPRAATVAAALGGAADAPGLTAALDLLDPAERPGIWQEALEAGFRARLLARIDAPQPAAARPAPRAQAVFCIDVRSEVLRRHLEQAGPYETLGFAGFFGLPVEVQAFGGDVTTEQCPVLVEPAAVVAERPDAGREGEAERALRGVERAASARDAIAGAKQGLAAKYVFAEAIGFVTGPLAAARTLAPRAAGRWSERLLPGDRVPTHLDVSPIPIEDRVAAAAGALTAMGLVDGFAPVVLLCGHGSTTTNNPHMAALDCGACGGHRGAHNARAMAAVLNDPDVRRGLAGRGIEIPAGTWFAAAEHDTATDAVRLLDGDVPPAHRATMDALRADLERAGAATAAERMARLPQAAPGDAAEAALTRSRDWAQLAPEWGLAGCAALIVGSSELTAGRDFGGRTFLHSYDAAADPDDAALTLILTAPLVVAHWIASQYYFSAVAPEQFGAGTKISHNVVGGIGVLSGPTGDLRGGLPWESVAVGDRLEHEPMRLLAVVDAPPDRIDGVLAGAPQVARLVDGGWVTLVARDAGGGPWQRRLPGGGWTAAVDAEVVA